MSIDTHATTDPGAGALRLSAAAERLRAVMVAHDKLLERVARRRGVKAELEEEQRASAARVVAALEPLVEERDRLDGEIHALFEALARDPRRSRRERREIERLHEELQAGDLLTPRDGRNEADDDGPDEIEHGRSHPDEPPHVVAAPSAARPKDERGVLRGLYLSLVEALHPDQVQDEDDKARRTEMMKQVTVAYQAGDYARLVEIERRWATSGDAPSPGVPASDEDVERRLAALERAMAELRRQLKAVDREIRALRAAPGAVLARELGQGGEGGLGALVAQAELELDHLRQVLAFTTSFRDGTISLREFLDGPNVGDDEAALDERDPYDDDDLSDEEMAETLAALLTLIDAPPPAPPPRRRKGRARR